MKFYRSVIMVMVSVLTIAGCGVRSANDTYPAGAASTVAADLPSVPVVDLTSVPGLGQSIEEVQRDDAIAYYEAYQRELRLQSCMQRAGFEYVITVHYPEPALASFADIYGVPATVDVRQSASEQAEYVASLAPDEADDYYLVLYGMSAEAFAARVQSQQEVVEGGCEVTAGSPRPGIWSVKQMVEQERSKLRTAFRESPAGVAWDAQALACTEDHGLPPVTSDEEADAAAEAGTEARHIEAVYELCSHIWSERQAEEQRVVAIGLGQTFGVQLLEHQSRYLDVLAEAKSDSEFLRHLGGHR